MRRKLGSEHGLGGSLHMYIAAVSATAQWKYVPNYRPQRCICIACWKSESWSAIMQPANVIMWFLGGRSVECYVFVTHTIA